MQILPYPVTGNFCCLLSNLFAGSLQDICNSLTAFSHLKILFPEYFLSIVTATAHEGFVLEFIFHFS